MAGVVERNIAALLERRRAEAERTPVQERIADRISRFAGSMRFVYIHLVVFGLWIAINLGWLGLPRFDRSFTILAMVASVEAIFLSTFVLITQNRMAAVADRRADLDLQVSLLAEHEVTRLITLVTRIADRMGIEEARDPALSELARDVAPERVLDEIEASERAYAEDEDEEERATDAGREP
ncbi:MAG TPA: DUF1003 domain-containing protein [Gemmatimonadaceae bacterium]|nr:DUF1003 domain-containing protein [Gemmatimonadaceae bacterium]